MTRVPPPLPLPHLKLGTKRGRFWSGFCFSLPADCLGRRRESQRRDPRATMVAWVMPGEFVERVHTAGGEGEESCRSPAASWRTRPTGAAGSQVACSSLLGSQVSWHDEALFASCCFVTGVLSLCDEEEFIKDMLRVLFAPPPAPPFVFRALLRNPRDLFRLSWRSLHPLPTLVSRARDVRAPRGRCRAVSPALLLLYPTGRQAFGGRRPGSGRWLGSRESVEDAVAPSCVLVTAKHGESLGLLPSRVPLAGSYGACDVRWRELTPPCRRTPPSSMIVCSSRAPRAARRAPRSTPSAAPAEQGAPAIEAPPRMTSTATATET